MVTWPSGLTITRDSFSETPPDRVIRTQMESGFDKVRRRSSATSRIITFKLFLSADDVDALDAFYLSNDAVRFDFTDPRTGDDVEARFMSPPTYQTSETMWVASINLEILP